jgi:hypothetical protein
MRPRINMRPRILAVEPMSRFRVRLTYEDGRTRVHDLSRTMARPVFEDARRHFRCVRVIPGGGLEWPGGAAERLWT